jgi:hypothetical protein
MRKTFFRAASLSGCLVLSLSSAALGWNHENFWMAAVASTTPGGGNIWGTGSRHDEGARCADCHSGGAGTIGLQFQFSPPLGSQNGSPAYAAGQTYAVTATMTGGHVKLDWGTEVMNGFGAAFETASGAVAGRLLSDSYGTLASPCASTQPSLNSTGTTVTYGDCHAVAHRNRRGLSSWSFTWTAPAAGAGPVTLYWGTVNSNGMDDSNQDDAQAGTLLLQEL